MATYFSQSMDFKLGEYARKGPVQLRPPTPVPPRPGSPSGPDYNKGGGTGQKKAPVMQWDPHTGNLKPMEYKPGSSLPGYKRGPTAPVVYDPRKVNPGLLKGLAHLGMRGARFHPLGRIIDMAFNIAYTLDLDNPWAIQGPASEGKWDYDFGDTFGRWSDDCGENYDRQNALSGYLDPQFRHEEYWRFDPQLRCILQPGNGAGWDITNPESSTLTLPANHNFILWGRRSWVADWWLHTENGVWIDRTNRPGVLEFPLVYTPGKPGYTGPLPLAEPPLPAISITDQPAPNPRTRPRLRPYEKPAISVDIGPGGPTHVPPVQTIHKEVPPGPGLKERKEKTTLGTALGLISALYDATTEAQEIVDILYKHLRKKCKGAKSMSEKANCVWRNLDSLNVAGAMADLIANHYEDQVYGVVFGLVGKHTPFGSMLPGSGPYRDPGEVKPTSRGPAWWN